MYQIYTRRFLFQVKSNLLNFYFSCELKPFCIQYVQFVKKDSKWNSDYSRNISYSMLRRTVARVVTQLPSIIYNSKIKILVGLLPTKNLLKFTKGVHFFTFLVNLF